MSRPKLKRPNSVILPATSDSSLHSIRLMTNSRSMTQIDTLKDGCKIDNIQPIKKWSYLENSGKNSTSCLPDHAINVNINESLPDKRTVHVYQPKSPSIVKENMRPIIAKRLAAKQNSADSLINKIERSTNVKTEYLVPNARPITNSRSMTQIDALKDGSKIGNIEPIKKWSYLENFGGNSASCATSVNSNETLLDKGNFHVHQPKSSSIAKESMRFVGIKSLTTKQNSTDCLINKLERDINTTTDYLVPNARPITNSRSMTQIDSIKDGFKIDKMQSIKKWTYLDNSTQTLSFESESMMNINMNESLIDKTNARQYKPKSAPIAKENFVFKTVLTKQNSEDTLINKTEEDSEAAMKLPEFSMNVKIEVFQDISQAENGEANGITRQKITDENEEEEKVLDVSSAIDTNDGSKNSSRKSFENIETTTSISVNREKAKTEECKDKEKMFEDESFFEDIWKSYVQRPLLPLKPLQKQRSLSCTNLVQTIKGLSKRKTSANNRFSSPENTLFESKELCTSEANISNMPPRKISVESADQNFRRLSDSNESSKTMKERQSLQHYLWYHMVDAKEASKRLLHMHQNGAFLIRPASNPTKEVLHTLCVVCGGRVYNYHIKNLKNGRVSLTTKNERKETFSSLLDMIKYHQTVPLTINLAGQVAHIHLLITPPK